MVQHQGERERARRLRQIAVAAERRRQRCQRFWTAVKPIVMPQIMRDLNEPRPIEKWLAENS